MQGTAHRRFCPLPCASFRPGMYSVRDRALIVIARLGTVRGCRPHVLRHPGQPQKIRIVSSGMQGRPQTNSGGDMRLSYYSTYLWPVELSSQSPLRDRSGEGRRRLSESNDVDGSKSSACHIAVSTFPAVAFAEAFGRPADDRFWDTATVRGGVYPVCAVRMPPPFCSGLRCSRLAMTSSKVGSLVHRVGC